MPRKPRVASDDAPRDELAEHLHRTVCQTLTSVRLLLGALAIKHTDDAELAANLRRLDDLLGTANGELRVVMDQLNTKARRPRRGSAR